MPHQRSMVHEIYEGRKIKDGYHKEELFWDIVFDNFCASNKLGNLMGRHGKIRQGKDSGSHSICDDRFMWGSKGIFFLDSLKMILRFLEETRIHTKIGHVMVTLQRKFKG